jgi:pimeloyl-ACP methyl ester carboxylesterase
MCMERGTSWAIAPLTFCSLSAVPSFAHRFCAVLKKSRAGGLVIIVEATWKRLGCGFRKWTWPTRPTIDKTQVRGLAAVRKSSIRLRRKGVHRHVASLTGDPAQAHTAVLFIPGAGGQAEQFYQQAALFEDGGQLCNTIGVFYSHHGHGPNTAEHCGWNDLSLAALTEQAVDMYDYALEQISDENRDRAKVFLVAHSYGCAIAVSALYKMPRVVGIMLLAPPIPRKRGLARTALLRLPAWLLDLARILDRRGGVHSRSVSRMLGWNGRGVDSSLAQLQLSTLRSDPCSCSNSQQWHCLFYFFP